MTVASRAERGCIRSLPCVWCLLRGAECTLSFIPTGRIVVDARTLRALDSKTPRTDIPVPRVGLAHVRGRGRGVGFWAVAGLDLLDAVSAGPKTSVHGQRGRRTEQAVADTVQFRDRRPPVFQQRAD